MAIVSTDYLDNDDLEGCTDNPVMPFTMLTILSRPSLWRPGNTGTQVTQVNTNYSFSISIMLCQSHSTTTLLERALKLLSRPSQY